MVILSFEILEKKRNERKIRIDKKVLTVLDM